jgi:hypothetical protein
LFDYARAQAGQTVMILGAAGNVGAYAVQLAAKAKLHVVAIVGQNDVDYVRNLGAETVGSHQLKEFDDAVRSVDVVIDTIGGDTRDRSLRLLRPGGILVSVVSTEAMPQRSDVRSVFFYVDFDQLMICPRKQADDRTRELRELKTKKSRTPVPITEETATVIREYLKTNWKENPQGLLFPNRRGRPWKRSHVVKFGLRPILKKLGLPTLNVGLHAFRHGLGTALANAGASPAVVKRTLRHTDVKTTLKFYVHADTDVQRSALARVQFTTNVGITTRFEK